MHLQQIIKAAKELQISILTLTPFYFTKSQAMIKL